MANGKDFQQRGITLHNPASTSLEVEPHQIAPGVEIFPGCHISGSTTSIGPGSRIGTDGPATIRDCQLDRNVTFASGFAEQATLLEHVSIGANAHIRPGCLLEEQASIAHCVGLKQTLLMPFVTLGSLINFCDCLMAGGTSRNNHSEVGSSYVHFNFTPRQDKATPSLFGDVPNGVLLDQPPIFLGGQGGTVGPIRMTYGTIQAAGTICRRDVLKPGTIVCPEPPKRPPDSTFDPNQFGNLNRMIHNNCTYLANLHALATWYQTVRTITMQADPFSQACLQGARQRLQQMVAERTKQMQKLADRLSNSSSRHPTHAKLCQIMQSNDFTIPDSCLPPPAPLVQYLQAGQTSDHLPFVQNMPADCKQAARTWLQNIVDNLLTKWEQETHE